LESRHVGKLWMAGLNGCTSPREAMGVPRVGSQGGAKCSSERDVAVSEGKDRKARRRREAQLLREREKL